MNALPNPTEVRSSARAALKVDELPQRNLFCRFYSRCLNAAVKDDWSDWTCAHCALAHEASDAPSPSTYSRQQPHE